MDSNTCGALQLPWWTSTHTETSLELAVVGEDLQSVESRFLWCHSRKRSPGWQVKGTGIYLDALVVAVSNQNLASRGGSYSLKVSELSLIPSFSSWNKAEKWIKLRRVHCFKGPHPWAFCSLDFALLTNPEDKVVFDGILGLAPRSAQGTASSLGSFLLLARGFPSSLCTIRGACGWGCIGCRVGCCGGGRGHLEAAKIVQKMYIWVWPQSKKIVDFIGRPETKGCVDGSFCCPHPPPTPRPCWQSVWRGFPLCAGHTDEAQVKSPLLWAQCTQTHRYRSCDQLFLHPRYCHLVWIPESTEVGKEIVKLVKM